jgi:hypothetical protein
LGPVLDGAALFHGAEVVDHDVLVSYGLSGVAQCGWF